MASIIVRKNKKGESFIVIHTYYDNDGKNHQKWETYSTYEEALNRKKVIESNYTSFTKPLSMCKTVGDLMSLYVETHGKYHWSASTFYMNVQLIDKLIIPYIGRELLCNVTLQSIEQFFILLFSMQKQAANSNEQQDSLPTTYMSADKIKKVYHLVNSAFKQAVKWGLVDRNPVEYMEIPHTTSVHREIWDTLTISEAINSCDNELLSLCLNIAFSCSMRLGEILALTWDCVDISESSVKNQKVSVRINKTLQRINKKALEAINYRDVFFTFPQTSKQNNTVLILKTPKTQSSNRSVYVPDSVAKMLLFRKEYQRKLKEMLGDEYHDYNLVIAHENGTPVEQTYIRKAFKELIEKNGFQRVCFHSLRHSSITYKLVMSGGDIKAVQGDSGHAQAQMVTDLYAHIIDQNRINNAKMMEKEFYQSARLLDSNSSLPEDSDKTDLETKVKEMLQEVDLKSLLKIIMKSIE